MKTTAEKIRVMMASTTPMAHASPNFPFVNAVWNSSCEMTSVELFGPPPGSSACMYTNASRAKMPM